MNILKIAFPFLVAFLALWAGSPSLLAQTADKDSDTAKPVPAKREAVKTKRPSAKKA